MSVKLERTATPGVYRRGARYVVTFRDSAGKQRKRFAHTYKEAKRLKSELTADVSRGEYRASARLTFAQYAPQWIASYRGRTRRGIGPDTLRSYRRSLGLDADAKVTGDGAIEFFGRRLLAEIGPAELREFSDRVAARGVSRNTVRLELAPVKALLATAHEDGLIRHNPVAGVRNLLPADDATGEEEEQVKALEPDQLRVLLEALPTAWRPFYEFLAETGLRIGEAIELRWKDVQGDYLHVRRRWYRGRVAPPKGRKSRRVPLSDAMAKALWNRRKETKGGDDDLVWTSERGRRVDQSNIMTRALKPAAVRAGLGELVKTKTGERPESWVGHHTFRHTCLTQLFRSGWNAKQVQMFAGHSDAGFTLRTYIHLLPEDLPRPPAVGNAWATKAAETSRTAELEQPEEIAV